MEVGELNNYLIFVRKDIEELKTQIKALDGGDRIRNVRGEYDKEVLYSSLQEISSRYRNLLKRDYECEKRVPNPI